MATRLGSRNASSRNCKKAARSSSPISPFSQTYGKIWPKATTLRRLNMYRIFHYSSGQLAGSCHITIWGWAIQPLNWVGFDPEKSGASGKFCPVCSGVWGTVRVALAANVTALAECVLKSRTSSPDGCVSLVIARRFSWSCLSVPSAICLALASARSTSNPWILSSIPVWSHWGGRNCCAWRSMSNMFLLTIPPMMAWSSTDTRATRRSCSVPDVARNPAHLPVQLIPGAFGGGGGLGFNYNRRNPQGFWYFCWCSCVSFCRMCS